jgi:SAM-dependent methyltransferase
MQIFVSDLDEKTQAASAHKDKFVLNNDRRSNSRKPMVIQCIACNGQHTARLGRLPIFTADILGGPLNGNFDAGSMYRCLDCSLMFRAPAPSGDLLASYYEHLSSDEHWQQTDREVWREIRGSLKHVPQRSILDVGCFRGDLLEYLGDDWERFGIEPSADARAVAESRKITVLADTIESLSDTGRQIGAITLVDVIEHLPRPLDALRKLSKMLLPGGQLIIFTGNTAAWSWRFAGLYYWYSAMPEHVAFFNPQWFEWSAAQLGCRLGLVRRLCYEPAPARARLDESLKNIAYATYRRMENIPPLQKVLARLPLINRVGKWQSCWWTSARDHILVVLTKDS